MHIALLQSNVGSLMKTLKSCHPQDFAIWKELAEIFIIKNDFTGKMEA